MRRGGEVWKIVRPNYEISDRDKWHISETELDNWRFDRIIINDGTVEDLLQKVDNEYKNLMQKIGERVNHEDNNKTRQNT